MNKNFRASICIPTYQMGDVIDNCLRSLLMGTSDDIEIVIVDDGSMDNTYQVCEQFTKSNSRFNYYKLDRSPSRKLGYTRNIAASFAKSNIIILHIDADDLWPSGLQKLIDFYLYAYNISSSNKLAIIGHHFAIIDKSTFWDCEGYDNLYRGEDREFMFRLACSNNLYFLDHRPLHTRMKRSKEIVQRKTIKDLWSQSKYDILCTDNLFNTLLDSLVFSFNNRSYSLKLKLIRFVFVPLCCLFYHRQRSVIQSRRPIKWNDFMRYKADNIGSALEILVMLDKDISFKRDFEYEKSLNDFPFDKKQNLIGFSL